MFIIVFMYEVNFCDVLVVVVFWLRSIYLGEIFFLVGDMFILISDCKGLLRLLFNVRVIIVLLFMECLSKLMLEVSLWDIRK